MKNLIVLFLTFSVIGMSCKVKKDIVVSPVNAMDIHVATNGNDASKGTESNPLLTIEAAQKKIKSQWTYRERIL